VFLVLGSLRIEESRLFEACKLAMRINPRSAAQQQYARPIIDIMGQTISNVELSRA